eukprot:Em0007g575a
MDGTKGDTERTRWAEAYAIPNQEAITVATTLIDEFFCRFSIPQQLHSDQGRQFESDVMKEVCKLLQISFSPFFLMFGQQAKLPVDLVYGSTPTEPQPQHEYARQLQKILQGAFQAARDNMGTATERMKEVYNQRVLSVLLQMLWEICCIDIPLIDDALSSELVEGQEHSAFETSMIGLLKVARISVNRHEILIAMAFFLMFGREVKLPIDLIEQTTLPEYGQKLTDGLENAYCLVRERCEAEHKRQKSIYDEKVHGKPLTVVINVAVLTIAVPGGKSRKFHHPWKGPFKVVERVAGCTYKIKCIKGTKTQCVHFDRLKQLWQVATSNPVREDLVAVRRRYLPRQRVQILYLWSGQMTYSAWIDDEEAEELDHRVADDDKMEAVPGPEPAAVEPPRRYPMHAKQATPRPLWALPAELMGGRSGVMMT